MLNWSLGFLQRMMNPSTGVQWFGAGLVVASLNLMVQMLMSLIFGRKSHMRGGDLT